MHNENQGELSDEEADRPAVDLADYPKLVEFYKKVDALCIEHCKSIPFPSELSTANLQLRQVKEEFSECKGNSIYGYMAYQLQVEMIARFAIEKLGAEEIKEEVNNERRIYLFG